MKIKNLNLNFNCLKKFKNLKINVKQLKNTIIAGVLVFTLSACGIPGRKSNTNSKVSNTPGTTTTIQAQKETMDSFDYWNLYDLDTNYSKYVSASNVSHSDLKISGELTQSQLYRVVKENNDRYMKNLKGATTYDEISDGKLNDICGYIVKTINNYKHLVDDINEVYCVLTNMKIFSKDTLNNASVSDNDVLIVSDKFFSIFKKKDMTLEEVISHESIHLIQKSCKDRLEKNELYTGVSIDFQDDNVENFTFSWLYEASAEKCSSKQLGKNPVKYTNDIHYLDLFNFVSGSTEFNLEEICFSKSVDKLFKKFDCYNDNDKKELLNNFFTIEILANNPSKISSKLYNTYNNVNVVKKQMKRDVYKYYTKLFFQNMKNNISDLNKETIYKNLALFEAIINSDLALDMSSQVQYNQSFMEYYVAQKNVFLYGLGSIYGIDAMNEYEQYVSLIDKTSFTLESDDVTYTKMLNSFIAKYNNYLGKNLFDENMNVEKIK